MSLRVCAGVLASTYVVLPEPFSISVAVNPKLALGLTVHAADTVGSVKDQILRNAGFGGAEACWMYLIGDSGALATKRSLQEAGVGAGATLRLAVTTGCGPQCHESELGLVEHIHVLPLSSGVTASS